VRQLWFNSQCKLLLEYCYASQRRKYLVAFCPSVHPVPCLANKFKTIVDILNKLGLYIDVSERKCRAHKPYSYPAYLQCYLPLTIFFIMDLCPGHILESTQGIEIKLGTYIDVNKRKCRRQEPYSYLTFYLSYLSLLLPIKGGFLCHVLVYKWCWITRSAFYRQYWIGIWGAFLASSDFLVIFLLSNLVIRYLFNCLEVYYLHLNPQLYHMLLYFVKRTYSKV